MMTWDQSMTERIAGVGAEVAQWVTHLGEPQVALPLLVVGLIALHGLSSAKRMLRSIIVHGLVLLILIQGTKRLVDRPRPGATLSALDSLPGGHLRQHAFPSGHSAFGAYIAGLLAFSAGSGLVAAGAVSVGLAVGWSRIAIGAHWFSDVVVGLGLGFYLAFLALRRHREPLPHSTGDSGI